jgi:hypothetical protein
MFGLTFNEFKIVASIVLIAIYTTAVVIKWRNK